MLFHSMKTKAPFTFTEATQKNQSLTSLPRMLFSVDDNGGVALKLLLTIVHYSVRLSNVTSAGNSSQRLCVQFGSMFFLQHLSEVFLLLL